MLRFSCRSTGSVFALSTLMWTAEFPWSQLCTVRQSVSSQAREPAMQACCAVNSSGLVYYGIRSKIQVAQPCTAARRFPFANSLSSALKNGS